MVHRKGSTASHPAGREEIPEKYREDGSYIIVGGSMSTGSYILVGDKKAEETFCSTMHGSGRTMSRTKAKKMYRGEQLQKDMLKQGIYVKSVSWSGLAEEAGQSYKDLELVVDSVEKVGISRRVSLLSPIGNLKG